MITQSLLIKTAYSYRNELLSVFEDKHFLIPIGRYDKYPYLLITETDRAMICKYEVYFPKAINSVSFSLDCKYDKSDYR